MKTLYILLLLSLPFIVIGQTLPNVTSLSTPNVTLTNSPVVYPPPNYGLTLTSTGLTVCAVGTTMKTSAQTQYNMKYGLTHINYENNPNRTRRLSTLGIGITITIIGLILQNKYRKKYKNG